MIRHAMTPPLLPSRCYFRRHYFFHHFRFAGLAISFRFSLFSLISFTIATAHAISFFARMPRLKRRRVPSAVITFHID
jgi:hypothetical protein